MRELETMIESIMVLCEGDIITEEDVSRYISGETQAWSTDGYEITGSIEEMVKNYEASLLKKVYEDCPNKGEMAKRLRTTRSTINRKLARYGIRK